MKIHRKIIIKFIIFYFFIVIFFAVLYTYFSNDFYYSFHHGKTEYSSMDSCLADVPRISFKDTIDIINAWCIDVVDGQGTILGQYLYINCSSGNCDKYK